MSVQASARRAGPDSTPHRGIPRREATKLQAARKGFWALLYGCAGSYKQLQPNGMSDNSPYIPISELSLKCDF